MKIIWSRLWLKLYLPVVRTCKRIERPKYFSPTTTTTDSAIIYYGHRHLFDSKCKYESHHHVWCSPCSSNEKKLWTSSCLRAFGFSSSISSHFRLPKLHKLSACSSWLSKSIAVSGFSKVDLSSSRCISSGVVAVCRSHCDMPLGLTVCCLCRCAMFHRFVPY
jgi:hypothetical protein